MATRGVNSLGGNHGGPPPGSTATGLSLASSQTEPRAPSTPRLRRYETRSFWDEFGPQQQRFGGTSEMVAKYIKICWNIMGMVGIESYR